LNKWPRETGPSRGFESVFHRNEEPELKRFRKCR
jgi:hypothetical protein